MRNVSLAAIRENAKLSILIAFHIDVRIYIFFHIKKHTCKKLRNTKTDDKLVLKNRNEFTFGSSALSKIIHPLGRN